MIKTLGSKFTDYLEEKEIIAKEEKEVYLYGSELLISEMISIVTVLGLGILIRHFWESIFYLLVYTSIRVYAGGYHAATHRKCIAFFNIMYIGIVCMADLLSSMMNHNILGIVLLSVAIIWILAPVEDARNLLEDSERVIYKKKTQKRLLFFSLLITYVYMVYPPLKDEMLYGIFAIIEVSALVLLGYIKNRMSDSLTNYKI
uniref:accessory gene regulator B family protein n=1 Tax=Agathobacter sp. TaxID=2021311 RepID=UPI0040568B9C